MQRCPNQETAPLATRPRFGRVRRASRATPGAIHLRRDCETNLPLGLQAKLRPPTQHHEPRRAFGELPDTDRAHLAATTRWCFAPRRRGSRSQHRKRRASSGYPLRRRGPGRAAPKCHATHRRGRAAAGRRPSTMTSDPAAQRQPRRGCHRVLRLPHQDSATVDGPSYGGWVMH